MKYIIAIIVVAFGVLMLDVFSTSFNQSPAPLGIEESEMTDEGYIQINQSFPRRFDQDGESTGNVEDDKRLIRDAANRMPSVTVTSVSIKDDMATVKVMIDEPMNDNERQAWENNLKSAIEGAIPRYEIKVIVK